MSSSQSEYALYQAFSICKFRNAMIRSTDQKLLNFFRKTSIRNRCNGYAELFKRFSIAKLFVLILDWYNHQLFAKVNRLGGCFKTGARDNACARFQAFQKRFIVDRPHGYIVFCIGSFTVRREYLPSSLLKARKQSCKNGMIVCGEVNCHIISLPGYQLPDLRPYDRPLNKAVVF